MKFTKLKQHLENAMYGVESFYPMYVIGGVDAYLRSEAAAMFKSVINPEYADFNMSILSLRDGTNSIITALAMCPVLDVRRYLILDLGDKFSESEQRVLQNYIKQPNPTSILVAIGGGSDAEMFALKEKSACFVVCDKLNRQEIGEYLMAILSTPPVRTISEKALDALVEKTSADMSRIVCETHKLKAYCDSEITLKDVDEMVSADLSYATYMLASAVSKKQSSEALSILDTFIKQGIKPIAILSQLYSQYRTMLHISLNKGLDDETLGNALNLGSSKKVYAMRTATKSYTQQSLKKSVDYLHSLQCAVLSGKRTENTGLVVEAVLTLLS